MGAFKAELLATCQCHCPQVVTVRGSLAGEAATESLKVGWRGWTDTVAEVEGTCSPEQVSLPTVLLIYN